MFNDHRDSQISIFKAISIKILDSFFLIIYKIKNHRR